MTSSSASNAPVKSPRWKNGAGKRCNCVNRPRCDCWWWIRVQYKGDTQSGFGPVHKFADLLEKHQSVPITRAGAEELAAAVLNWLVHGKPMTGPAMTATVERTGNDLIDGWLKWRLTKNVNTKESSNVKRAREAFGAMSMSQLVEPGVFPTFVKQELAKGWKICTPNRILGGAMRPAIRWGLAQEPPWLTKNPFGEHRFKVRVDLENRRTERCTPEHEGKLLAAVADIGPRLDWLADLVVLSIDLGTRTGELHQLTNADVDWHGATVTLRETKRGETRKVPFNLKGRVADVLQRRRFAGPTAKIVTVAQTHEGWMQAVCVGWGIPVKWTDNHLTRETRAAYKAVNLRLHDLRHEAATWWGICGVSDEDREFLQGHKSQWMQGRYSHEKLARAKAALAEKVWPRERERAQFPKRAKAQGA